MSNLVQRVNLYPCPVSMRNLTTSKQSAGTGLDIKDGVATITPGSALIPYAYFTMTGLTPGAPLTFHCTLEYLGDWADGDTAVCFYRRDWGTLHVDWTKGEGTDVTAQFTVPHDGYLYFRFWARGDGLKVSGINIESTSTFDKSLPFFYHGTMPYPRSA